MKKLIPLLLLAVMFTAGCDLSGISLTTTNQPPLINSFGASPGSIAAGEYSTLNWSVTGATTVSIDQGIGNVALSGSRAVMPSATTIYKLTATNAVGVSGIATAQVIVTGSSSPSPAPSPTPTPSSGLPVVNYFTASPSSIYAGDSTILSWSVSNATSVSINNGVGVVGLSGSVSVWPTTSTTYILTATNAAGWWTKGTTVLVSGEPLPSSFSVTSALVSVDPPFFSGTCPTTVNSYAVITANGPGTVTYRWEDSEGGYKSTENVYFSSAGSQSVNTSWPVGKSGSYWVRLHVLTPNETLSNQASFSLSCASAPTGWAGTWSTNWGTMVLNQTGDQVSGTYTWDSGHIEGTVTGNVFSGIWSEAPSYSLPDDAGEVQLTISPDGQTLSGQWRYGFSGSWYGWSGTRMP